jgi:oligopeptide transport system permease protein
MGTYVLRRLLLTIVTLWGALTLLFLMFQGIPGSSIEARYSDRYLNPTIKKNFEKQYGLDKPVVAQYALYWKNLATGDLGKSQVDDQPVMTSLRKTAKTSSRLAFWGLFVQIAVGISSGVIAAVKKFSWFDNLTGFLSVAIIGIPVFVSGILFQWVFGVLPGPNHWNWPQWTRFPVVGFDKEGGDGTWFLHFLPTGHTWKYVIGPAIVIAAVQTGSFSRLTRTSMLEVLRSDYLRTAAAKGLSRRRIIVKHAMRNAMIPVVTSLAGDVISFFGVAVLTETVFNLNGIGSKVAKAAAAQDAPVVMGLVGVVVVLTSIVYLLVDIGYGLLDPRVRLQ